MQFQLRPILAAIAAVVLCCAAVAQTPAHTTVPPKRYCQPEHGFCFRYPGTWSVEGEVFAGNGVVVAPEQKQERARWDEITVAMIVPPPQGDADPIPVDLLIEQTMASLREEGQNLETMQRQVRTVDSKPAQLLTVRYQEKATGRTWVEKLAFIAGPNGEIYSVALKCAPESLTRLEPVLSSVLQSWKLPEPVPQDEPASDEGAPKAKSPEREGSVTTAAPAQEHTKK